MKFGHFVSLLGGGVVLIGLFLSLSALHLSAQATNSGTLRGKLTDPSGAVIEGAAVTAKAASGEAASATTNHQGIYEIKGLAPGKYTVSAVGKGFAEYHETDVEVDGRTGTAIRYRARH